MSGFTYIESNRVSKAQKRRDLKAAKKAEQLKRIEESEKLDEHKDRRLEQENLKALLDCKHLRIYDIEADGDCLYRAVEHQLNVANDSDEDLSHQDIRNKTSRFMLENAEDFMPFLTNDNGDLMSKKDYEIYCTKIAKTKEWGGHLELTAISRITRRSIHIYQANNNRPIIIEPPSKTDKKPILLSFHKHLYHLGEHYNSLIAAT